MESEEFLLLSTHDITELISSDELNVINEEDVFTSVMKWVRFNIAERKDKLKEVTTYLRPWHIQYAMLPLSVLAASKYFSTYTSHEVLQGPKSNSISTLFKGVVRSKETGRDMGRDMGRPIQLAQNKVFCPT